MSTIVSPEPRPGPVILAAIMTAVLVAIASAMPRFRVSPLHVQGAWWAYRITRRIGSVMRRFAAGLLVPPRGRRRRAAASGRVRERLDLPRYPNWLCPLAPGVSCFGTQIAHLFETNPEMMAMAAAAPRLGRALRPLLRALGAQIPPVLRAPACAPARAPVGASAPPRPDDEAGVAQGGAGRASGVRAGPAATAPVMVHARWIADRGVGAPPPPVAGRVRDAARGDGG